MKQHAIRWTENLFAVKDYLVQNKGVAAYQIDELFNQVRGPAEEPGHRVGDTRPCDKSTLLSGGVQHREDRVAIFDRRGRVVGRFLTGVVDGLNIRAAVDEALDTFDVAVRAGLRGNHASSARRRQARGRLIFTPDAPRAAASCRSCGAGRREPRGRAASGCTWRGHTSPRR